MQSQNTPALAGVNKLLSVMARLRAPEGGCPWDVEQSYATITKYTLEEVYEVVEAIETQDIPALREELGDLLFQIVFYSQIGAEKGHFTFDEIAAHTAEKMITRHPHVFAGKSLADTEALMKMWESEKAQQREEDARAEGREPSALDGVITAMPALSRAVKLQSRAARVGFAWKDLAPVFEKLNEEIGELKEVIAERDKQGEPLELDLVDRLTEELGDVLFVVANIGRSLRIDPELALRTTNRKFEERFRGVEAALHAKGKKLQDATLEEMIAAWNAQRKAK